MSNTPHPLGRRYAEDPRDRLFPMAAIMQVIPTPTYRYWTLGSQLDQGQTPRCVGNAARQLLTSSPHRFKQAHPDANEIYFGAQDNDEWPGNAYDGTSARGAMKYLQSLSIIAAYHWAGDVEEMCQFILTTGPVLVGGNWHNDAFNPVNGVVKQTGPVAGGHEIICYGYNHKTWTLSFDNSWGSGWGKKGRFVMNRTDFENWMADQGDMCAPVEA